MSSIAVGRSRPFALGWPVLPAEIVGPLIALLGAVLSVRPALDSDLGWHLRTGQLILTSHYVPRTDPFSHTRLGQAWVDNEWLWESGLALLNRAGGVVAVVIGNAILVGVTIALVYLTLRLRKVSVGLAAAGATAAPIALLAYEDVRPGMVGALFIACFLVFLQKYRNTGQRGWLLPLLPCEIVWANCHGSYVIGPLLCGLYALAEVWETHQWRRLDVWALLCGALVLTTRANPIGFGLVQFTLKASSLTFNRAFVQAWKGPDFNSVGFVPLFVALLLSIVLPLLWSTVRVPKPEALLMIVSTLAVLRSNEFLPLYAIAAVPVLAQLAQAVLKPSLNSKPAPALVTSLLFAVALLTGSRVGGLEPSAYEQAISSNYPARAVDFIKQAGLQGPLWNDFDWGGYLISALPELPVLVDSRTEMYGDDFLHQYLAVAWGTKPPTPIFEQYGIRLVLIPSQSTLATELRTSKDWQEDYQDELASVFEPRAL